MQPQNIKMMAHLVEQDVPVPFGCEDCKHYLSFGRCKAFDLIPLEHIDIGEGHTSVLSGQLGAYVFEAAREREYRREYVMGED